MVEVIFFLPGKKFDRLILIGKSYLRNIMEMSPEMRWTWAEECKERLLIMKEQLTWIH